VEEEEEEEEEVVVLDSRLVILTTSITTVIITTITTTSVPGRVHLWELYLEDASLPTRVTSSISYLLYQTNLHRSLFQRRRITIVTTTRRKRLLKKRITLHPHCLPSKYRRLIHNRGQNRRV
jgi:hypothetical protein